MTLVLIDSAMKTLFRYFAPVAIAAIAFSACNRETDIEVPSDETVHITVTAQANDLLGEDGTRTYIDTYQGTDNYILWGTGEYMKIAVTAGENTEFGDSAAESADAFNGQPQATFNFSITPGTAATYLYQGLYPASSAVASSNTNPASYKVNLISTQNATATSYDPAAYIMVAKPTSFTSVQTQWMASYRRATALNKITLTGLTEDIKRVKITAPEGVYLAGGRHIDLTTGESNDIYYGGGRTETIEVKYDSKLPGGNAMTIWFTSWEATIPVGGKLTIVAYSDAHTFTREITVANNAMTFKEGYLNKLSINMAHQDVVQGVNTELEEGNYVVLAEANNHYYALKAEANGTRMASVEYTGSLDSYNTYGGDPSLVWAISKSGSSYIFANGNNYLGWDSGNNAEMNPASNTWTTINYLLDVTYDGTNNCYTVTVNNDSTRKLGRNSSSDWFAFYTSAQQNKIVFVPVIYDDRTSVTLSFGNPDVSLTPAEAAEYSGQTAKAYSGGNEVTGLTISYSWDGDSDFGGLNEETGTINLSGEPGTATVTATFEGNETYSSASASYTITVTDGKLTLTFPFTSPITDWPTSSTTAAAGSYTYALSGTDYSFTHTKSGSGIYCQTSYLMICSGNYLGLPAIDGYKLTSVAAQLNSGGTPSTSSVGTITSNTNGTVVSGGEAQTFSTVGGIKTFSLSGTSENTVYYLAISNKNFQCIGIELKYEPVAPDTREEADMSWSASTATATITSGENGAVINFTAPTLDEGNASNISYESTNTAVATISSAGIVTIVGPGETSIKAIFEGNENYKPQTVSYDLTVTDNRETVATPTFNPVQGTVEAGTAVSISCTTAGATIHYTMDGTEPTASSATYTTAITVNATVEIKAIAVKTGYKDSAIATARYTVNGGGGTYSLTPNQASTGSNATTYITSLTEFTYNGISWKMNQWNPKNLQIKTNQSSPASEFRFYNTSAFSGRISKVVITFSTLNVVDATKLMFLGGSSEVTATTGGTAGTWNSTDNTLTWTPAAADSFTYFAFYQNGKAASGNNYLEDTDAIVVTYE